MEAPEPEPPENSSDASRRTRLAAERTLLAWWRTALGTLAVGIGIGRVVPELSNAETQWPYALLGLAFTIFGIVLLIFGSGRFTSVERALREGGYAELNSRSVSVLTTVAAILAALTGLLILLG